MCKLTAWLVSIGALNWGLVALLDFDLVMWVGSWTHEVVATIVYILVGLAGLKMIIKMCTGKDCKM